MADACIFIIESIDFKDIINSPLKTQNSKLKTANEIRNTHINIGTGQDISIEELAKLIKKVVGFEGKLVFDASKPDGTMVKLTDPSKLHALGWKHKVELEEGIEEVYRWFMKGE